MTNLQDVLQQLLSGLNKLDNNKIRQFHPDYPDFTNKQFRLGLIGQFFTMYEAFETLQKFVNDYARKNKKIFNVGIPIIRVRFSKPGEGDKYGLRRYDAVIAYFAPKKVKEGTRDFYLKELLGTLKTNDNNDEVIELLFNEGDNEKRKVMTIPTEIYECYISSLIPYLVSRSCYKNPIPVAIDGEIKNVQALYQYVMGSNWVIPGAFYPNGSPVSVVLLRPTPATSTLVSTFSLSEVFSTVNFGNLANSDSATYLEKAFSEVAKVVGDEKVAQDIVLNTEVVQGYPFVPFEPKTSGNVKN